MNKKIIAFLITPLVLIFSMVTLSFGQFIPNAPFKSEEVIAPDFSLKDLQGKTFKLSKYSGKPVLLFFGATWCPSCRAEIPAYKNIYATYSKSGLEVIYIDIMEPAEKVARFAKTNSLTYKVLLDEDGNVADNYGIIGVPTLILIDKQGYVVKISHRTADLPLSNLFPAKK
ncbi:MAG: TlpA disulfide reductase family protein [Smithellaceae bacterium]|jgi:peroxiredoxin